MQRYEIKYLLKEDISVLIASDVKLKKPMKQE